MLLKIRTITKQKGQGIVEYALLLAFVVGIAMMLNGANLGGAVKDTFDKVAKVLNGEVLSGEKKDYAWALENLSGLSKDDIKTALDNEERLKLDQEALANIGRFFLDKDEDFVKALLKNNGINMDNTCLGYYGEAKGNSGTTTYWVNNDTNGANRQYGDLMRWMQGDYGVVGENNTISYTNDNTAYSSDKRYLYSDYALNNNTNNRNGIKLGLSYDEHGNVKEAQVGIDTKAINSGTGEKALWVKVTRGATGYEQVIP